MSRSYDDIRGLLTSRITVPVGATLAVFVDVISGERAFLMKYVSGGTLEILPASLGASLNYAGFTQSVGSPNFVTGSTQTPAMLAALSGTGYVMTSQEVLSFDGPVRMYLSATGQTTIVHTIYGKGAGA